MMRGRPPAWRCFNSPVSAAWPAAVIGTFSTIFFVLQSREPQHDAREALWANRAFTAFDEAIWPIESGPSGGPIQLSYGAVSSSREAKYQPFGRRLLRPASDQLSEK